MTSITFVTTHSSHLTHAHLPPHPYPHRVFRRWQLDGHDGQLIWGAQFGSGAGDQAVGLVLGPETSVGVEPKASEEERGGRGGAGGASPLYLTGWTRGALYSSVPGMIR